MMLALTNMNIKKAAINPQIHTGLFRLVFLVQNWRNACVFDGFHVPLKYIQKKMRKVPISNTDQGTGTLLANRAQMPTPKELTPKPINIERRTKGTFIQNRPKAFEG
jgi:hypothetical protein